MRYLGFILMGYTIVTFLVAIIAIITGKRRITELYTILFVSQISPVDNCIQRKIGTVSIIQEKGRVGMDGNIRLQEESLRNHLYEMVFLCNIS